MNTNVSYGSLPPAMIGGLGVVVRALLSKANRGESPVLLKKLPEVIEFSDSGIWGDESLDENVDPRIFRVSDFVGDFRLDYESAPARSIPEDKLHKFQLRNGDVLVVKSSGSAKQIVSGRVAVFENSTDRLYAASNFLIRLRSKRDIDPHYLAFVLGSPPLREAIADLVKTMTYPNLSFRIYSDLNIPVIPLQDQQVVAGFFRALLNHRPLTELPNYLAEQRRIVARIDELAAKIEEAKGLRRQTIEEAEAVVKSAARQVLSEVNVSITNLGSWLDGEREGIQTGPFGAQLGSTDFTESGTPVLTIGNIQYDGLHLDSLKRVSQEKAAQLERYRVKMGDVLFARMGTVGRCCIVPSEAEGWLINYHIIRVALDKQRVEPRYIHWTIQASAEVEEYLDEKIRGATRQGVNSTIVRDLPCRVPLVSEQRRIATYLDNLQAKIDGLKQFQAETAVELDAMLPSILDKAFKGGL